MKFVTKQLSGWGRINPVETKVYYPATQMEIHQIFQLTNESFIARGLGRSYGDAAVSKSITMDLTEYNFFQKWDSEKGIIRVTSGVTLRQILDFVIPQGWFLAVTPGTQECTVGGCIAADVHGKNHHVSGAFSKYVRRLELLCSDGSNYTCSLEENSDLFFATIGGMGFTGIILNAELQLIPIETMYITERRKRVHSWEECVAEFQDEDFKEPYAVAWIDATSTKGKGEIWYGKHSTKDELPKFVQPIHLKNNQKAITVPDVFQTSLIHQKTVQWFNRLKWANTTKQIQKSIVPYWKFFYPLDRLREWYRLYGRDGFIQYQYVVPYDTPPDFHREIIGKCLQENQVVSLCVFKRMGKGYQEEMASMSENSAKYLPTLSFPRSGWTVALDFPMKTGLLSLLHQLDQMVIDAGGRVYLAKDARLSATAFRQMYPQITIWKNVCRKYNPEIRFVSELSKRLELC